MEPVTEGVGFMVEGLIIAAGKSRRTGDKYKMTLDFSGRTLLEISLGSMAPFCSRIIVVTGYKAQELGPVLGKYPQVQIVYNPAYEEGMFSSVKAGLREIKAEHFFFLPGDCPLVSPAVYQKLLSVDAEIVLPTYNGLPGHPVLFRQTVIAEILNNTSYGSLREFISAHKPVFVPVDCPGILKDIDTLADYREALQFWSGNS
jgi:molybdenum cofactor cytidylyltransferase